MPNTDFQRVSPPDSAFSWISSRGAASRIGKRVHVTARQHLSRDDTWLRGMPLFGSVRDLWNSVTRKQTALLCSIV